jgi:hypothetical protein
VLHLALSIDKSGFKSAKQPFLSDFGAFLHIAFLSLWLTFALALQAFLSQTAFALALHFSALSLQAYCFDSFKNWHFHVLNSNLASALP